MGEAPRPYRVGTEREKESQTTVNQSLGRKRMVIAHVARDWESCRPQGRLWNMTAALTWNGYIG